MSECDNQLIRRLRVSVGSECLGTWNVSIDFELFERLCESQGIAGTRMRSNR